MINNNRLNNILTNYKNKIIYIFMDIIYQIV